ncbi:uncharacterized protein PFB0765w-like [Prunus persica]|uniref:uncharacterized protein PFB0765w-like n=1 Tax=Prunus persica TaxID=3760 RepID=UPI0009AB50F5|nr:uncharacterized protein PFB0765w-like [Prunus persica]
MAQRIKTKPKPNYDRKAKHPDYVQFRCNAYAFNSIIRDIKDKLNERQKKLLKKTPFWNLIELFYRQRIDMNNMNKSDIDLAQLLKTFDPDTKYTATFRTRHFGEKGKPSKNQDIFKTPKKPKTTREEEDTVEKEKEKEDDEGKPDDAIQDLLVKSMTDQINYRQQQDPSFVCPERLQLWKDEKNEDSEKKMKELWDIFIQVEKRSKELEVELATYIEKLDNEECVTATMTVESTVQLNEIQNLKRRIAELEGKETGIDMEKIAKKKEIQEKYKAEIESLLSDPTIFEMEMDLPTKQPTQPVEEKEEEKKEEEKQQEEREEEKKQDAPTPDVPSKVQRVKNRERKRLQASCYVYEKNKKTKKEAKKDDEELPQFKLISSEELTQEASQPDATNPIPDPPKGTSLHDSIPVDLQQSSDEDEGQKKQTKKKLGWGQKKVWQKIPKPDRERIEKHYLSTQLR